MVSFAPRSQIGPNPYAEWSDEDLVTRCNGFERKSPAMEVELLERVYLPCMKVGQIETWWRRVLTGLAQADA
jgi:hypothetical protein